MLKSEYEVKNIRRDLEKLNLGQLKKLAKERGFDKKNAKVYGNAQRRSTWVKLLLVNTPEFHDQTQEKPKQEVNKPVIPAIKQRVVYGMKRVVYGLKRLPEIKTTVYFYHQPRGNK